MPSPVGSKGVTFFWDPSWLNAASTRAFRDAAFAVKHRMEATKPEHRIPIKGPFFGSQVKGAARGVKEAHGAVAVIKGGGLAPIFEKGAKPHRIVPKGTKSLRRSISKGQEVFKLRSVRGATTKVLAFEGRFAASVNHPGMRAQPFMGPAARMFGPLYRTALARSLPRPRIR